MSRRRIFGFVLVSGLFLAACSSGAGHVAQRRPPASSSSPSTTGTSPTTSSTPTIPPTTTTTTTKAPSPFPAVVVQAMAQFTPLPAGALAPMKIPEVSGYLTAQTGGLGGEDSVTLVATPSPVPVDSPDLSSAGGTEIAEFATTPTASDADADTQLSQAKSQDIDTCGGSSQPLTLSGGTQATTCPTLDGAAVDWSVGGWQVQVLTLSGTTPSVSEANQLCSTLSGTGLPSSDGGGIVSVVVPANASVGKSDTAALEWVVGSDFYQVRSSDNPVATVQTAAAMRPYPGG